MEQGDEHFRAQYFPNGVPNFSKTQQVQGSPPTPPPHRKSWFSRNWLWLIPLVVGVPILGCAGCFGGFAFMVMSWIRGSTPYTDALHMVRADAQVQQMIGSPVTAGWWALGSMETNNAFSSNASGTADFYFPVSGPNGSGTVYVYATMQQAKWTMHQVTFTDDGSGNQLDLIALPQGSQGSSSPSSPASPPVGP